jgi:hypothetical protein
MGRVIGWVLAAAMVAVCPRSAAAEEAAARPGLARELLQGCLKTPSQQSATRLASAVGAKPYSDIRRKRELKTDTAVYQEPASDEDQRTRTTVTAFEGWDLAGPGAGALEYQEQKTETDWVDRATRQSVTPVRTALSRSCRLHAPVANARAIFELYEGLTERSYGIRISADRRWVDIFMFDEERFDIELSFNLEAPLAGVAPDAAQQDGRMILSDGGPRFIGGVSPGVATVTTDRATLLAGLDRAAAMSFVNMEIQPVVQRLAGR